MVSTSPDSTSAIRRAYTCPNTLANVATRSTARKFAFALFVLPDDAYCNDDDDDDKCVVLHEYYERDILVHIEKRRMVNEVSLSENVSRRDSKNKIQIHKKRRKVNVFDDANEDDDDDVHILTSAAFKASSCSESFFVFLFFLFFFFSITVLRSSSSSSSRGCWCFSLVVSLLFRRVFTIACVSVLRKKSHSTKAREEKSLSKILSSFFLSLSRNARANASAVWGVSSPLKLRTPLIRNPWTL